MHRLLRPLSAALATAGLVTLLSTTVYAQGVRPEIGKPLQQAGELLKAGKGKEALAKVREAEAVSGRTPAEQLTIDRMKAAAAQRAGETATAVQALESLYEKASGAEKGQVAEQIAGSYIQLKNNAKAGEWVAKAQQAGNNGASLKQLQGYLQSASGDFTAIAKDAGAAVAAAEQAGKKPEESDLLRLADALQRTGNNAGNIAALEKLVAHYPKKDYVSAYLGRLQRKPGFSDRFVMDIMRVRMAQGLITKGEDYFEMAQLALQADQFTEAKAIMDKGFAAKVLGTGADADRHKRLADLTAKKLQEGRGSLEAGIAEAEAAKDGNQLVKIGNGLIGIGDLERGIPLLEKGIAKGGLKRIDDAKLRLGLAQLKSGNRAKATQTLRSVGGNDGAADIARLWLTLGGSVS